MNDGSTLGYVAPVRGHRCQECVYYPAPPPAFCFCQKRGKQVKPGETACVLGRRRRVVESLQEV